jgi:hypothetical protein
MARMAQEDTEELLALSIVPPPADARYLFRRRKYW